ncbi:MAG: hypothetical protein QXX12_07210 [Nanopusillaceae archaeon]
MGRKKLKGWAKSSANRITSVSSGNLNFSKSSDNSRVSTSNVIVSNLGESYSRELRNLTYFEVYGSGREIRTRRGIYYRYPGVVLSGFRMIDVLVSRDLLEYLHKDERKRKFIVVRKCGGNTRVVVRFRDIDKISYIYDLENLKRLTGKNGTIPERLLMRLRTLKNGWVTVRSLESILQSTNFSVCGILILQVVGNQVGMKLYEVTRHEVLHFPWSQLSDRFIARCDRNGRITVVTVSNIPFITMRDMFSSFNSYVLHQGYGFPGDGVVEGDIGV